MVKVDQLLRPVVVGLVGVVGKALEHRLAVHHPSFLKVVDRAVDGVGQAPQPVLLLVQQVPVAPEGSDRSLAVVALQDLGDGPQPKPQITQQQESAEGAAVAVARSGATRCLRPVPG